MRPLSASQLLSLWEYGLAQPGWQRALILLAGALPDSSPEALASLPLGRRDAQLLVLRENLFGPQLTGMATCPSCGERLELSFDVADIQAEGLSEAEDEQARASDGRLSLAINDYAVTFRLPNSLDLAEIARMGTPEQARLRLLERCLHSAEEKGVACPAEDLPDAVTSAIAGRMASADPQGDVQITLTCPNCTYQWQTTFDILSFLWIEINDWAQRILREVHLLASAYSWREADILALSPGRRQAYLQMVMG
jgi:hypothetical protein